MVGMVCYVDGDNENEDGGGEWVDEWWLGGG